MERSQRNERPPERGYERGRAARQLSLPSKHTGATTSQDDSRSQAR